MYWEGVIAERIVICALCQRRIKDRDDLVTSLYVFSVAPYHSDCWVKAIKSYQTLVVANKPINTGLSTAVAVFASVLALVTFIGPFPKIPGLLLLLAPAIRLYSWFMYEKPLA